ncbi:memo-like protein [Rozella allomycis CSF55]|uniref:Memo-like protein n=1 Tax=Rozella allomycis (strain CSF55) TaxID=988480 RepID=A0A4P9YGS4_ROZAC|nr:memo-like protein [Rozella allomycis CSF55]
MQENLKSSTSISRLSIPNLLNQEQENDRKVRKATHAGTWYEDNSARLNDKVLTFIDNVVAEIDQNRKPKALIVPHAGLKYSGQTAAYAYNYLQQNINEISKIFVLGPSHHCYLEKPAVSTVDVYETPLGNIEIDTKIAQELISSGAFSKLPKDVDEDEHSIEMQLPFIAHILNSVSCKVSLIPILIGQMNKVTLHSTVKTLLPYFDEPDTVFIISSDFCHYGPRFSYTPFSNSKMPIYSEIEQLDNDAINMILDMDLKSFEMYLNQTGNTICGRHAISFLLRILSEFKDEFSGTLLHYSQSNKTVSGTDSSVSYAAIAFTTK